MSFQPLEFKGIEGHLCVRWPDAAVWSPWRSNCAALCVWRSSVSRSCCSVATRTAVAVCVLWTLILWGSSSVPCVAVPWTGTALRPTWPWHTLWTPYGRSASRVKALQRRATNTITPWVCTARRIRRWSADCVAASEATERTKSPQSAASTAEWR